MKNQIRVSLVWFAIHALIALPSRAADAQAPPLTKHERKLIKAAEEGSLKKIAKLMKGGNPNPVTAECFTAASSEASRSGYNLLSLALENFQAWQLRDEHKIKKEIQKRNDEVFHNNVMDSLSPSRENGKDKKRKPPRPKNKPDMDG